MVDKLELNTITYEWLEKTNEPKLLKKAIKLLKDDGNYFPDLTKAIETKLMTLDEKYKQRKLAEHVSQEDIEKSKEQLNQFIAELNESEKIIKEGSSKIGESAEQLLLKHKKEADNEKNKGNELMRTKEYDEAIKFYNNSIQLYEYEPTTYCNRALAYLKVKQYKKAIEDCNTALQLKKDYIKAYYRRALANISMKNYKEGMDDLLTVLNDNPKSKEINDEITKTKKEWIKDKGEDEWNKYIEDFEYKINLAKEGKFQKDNDYGNIAKEIKDMNININKDNKEENKENKEGGVKVNIVEEKEEKKEEKKEMEEKKKEDEHKGFKKIQIVEEED